ncbi:MAG: hypothetical protein H6978_13170 [Gammaproteobacteria bacterium]|nr:hypothetical protein [Gammaproteobacteria bacterium]
MLMLPLPSHAAGSVVLEDTGFNLLQGMLGDALPDGASITPAQVEASTSSTSATYLPDTTDAEFTGKAFVDYGNGGAVSGHATAVGRQIYGNASSMAAGVTVVHTYPADDWLAALTTTGAAGNAERVTNHSWVGTADSTAQAQNLLSRVDALVQNTGGIHVVGAGAQENPILSHAFNVIAVSTTNTQTIYTTTAVNSVYTAGRTVPHLVAPLATRSLATGLVSSAAILLLDASQATLAPETVKAMLMAGASRRTLNLANADIGDYRAAPDHAAENGLDKRYGAGQLDIAASYRILAAGDQAPVEDGGVAIALTGYHHEAQFGSTGDAAASFRFTSGETGERMSTTLAWPARVTSSRGGLATTLVDLNLALYDLTAGTTVAVSASTGENTENIHLELAASHDFELQVTAIGGNLENQAYALAWSRTPNALPLPAAMVPILFDLLDGDE